MSRDKILNVAKQSAVFISRCLKVLYFFIQNEYKAVL